MEPGKAEGFGGGVEGIDDDESIVTRFANTLSLPSQAVDISSYQHRS